MCSVASEEIRQEDWGIDVVLTGTQKGLGTPPGLSLVCASPRAVKVRSAHAPSLLQNSPAALTYLQTMESRSAPIASYYSSWKRWLPIMKAYEAGTPSYFATPPVNLIYAFHASLTRITKGSPTLEKRFILHKEASKNLKLAAADLGLKQVAVDPAYAANGMTAVSLGMHLLKLGILTRFASSCIIPRVWAHPTSCPAYLRRILLVQLDSIRTLKVSRAIPSLHSVTDTSSFFSRALLQNWVRSLHLHSVHLTDFGS